MRGTMVAALVLFLTMVAGCQQQQTATASSQPANRGGVNVGSLSCNVAGGVGFVDQQPRIVSPRKAYEVRHRRLVGGAADR